MAFVVRDQIPHEYGTVAVAGEDLPVLAEADVVVVGGGPAGAMAAIAAGRQGARVILLEAQPLLGGIGVGGAIHWYYYGVDGGIQQELDERDAALGARLTDKVSGWHYAARPLTLADMAAEAGVQVWLRTVVTGGVMEGATVRGVVVDGRGGRGVIWCQVCVDATGDADVAALAGVDFRLGRAGDELQMAYSLTPGVARGDTVIAHANFDAGWVDPTDPWDYARAFVDGRKFLWHDEYNDENRLYFCSPNLGVRESRLVVGDYTLTLDDLFFRQRFPDTIGRCRSHYDNHSRDYANESDEATLFADVLGNWMTLLSCDVPYRCLLPQRVEGLLVAGRCISMTHDAEQALRMMKDMHRIGEAAGLAAAIAVADGVTPRAVDVSKLQALLVQSGVLSPDEVAEGAGGGRDELGDPAELLAELAGEHPAPAMWRLYRLGEAAAPVLERALASPNTEVARWSALVLGAMGRECARPLLLEMVRSRDERRPAQHCAQPRWVSALICLAAMGGAEVPALLAGALESDSEFGGRWLHALKAMGQLGDRSVVPAIKRFLERIRSDPRYWSDTSDVRRFAGWKLELMAAQALIALSEPEGEAIARRYLSDRRLPVRRWAARILGMRRAPH